MIPATRSNVTPLPWTCPEVHHLHTAYNATVDALADEYALDQWHYHRYRSRRIHHLRMSLAALAELIGYSRDKAAKDCAEAYRAGVRRERRERQLKAARWAA